MAFTLDNLGNSLSDSLSNSLGMNSTSFSDSLTSIANLGFSGGMGFLDTLLNGLNGTGTNWLDIDWQNIDWGQLLGSDDLGSFLQDTNFSSAFNTALNTNTNWDDIFQFLGDSSFLSDIDLGSFFEDLGSSDFLSDFDLSDLFEGLDGVNLGGFTIGDLLDDFSSIFGDINFSDLFGGLDDDYYYVFDSLSTNNLFQSLSQFNFASGSSAPTNIDLLDGMGSFLNTIGESGLLKNLTVSQLVRGSLGTELLIAEAVGDLLLGLAGNDRLVGNTGSDLLNGGMGNDRLRGLVGNDIMTGMDGNDRLLAGKGDDVLFGGVGVDTLVTGTGRDLVVLGLGLGREIIRDFRAGQDRLGLLDSLGSIDVSDLDISQRGRDTLVSYGKEALALLKGVNSDRVTASDFVNLG